MGSRGTETGEKLWEYVSKDNIQHVMSDYWNPYNEFIPEKLHTRSKKETFTVEGYNSLLRHFLARLRRKTKCYSKSKLMLQYSVISLMQKWNDGFVPILI